MCTMARTRVKAAVVMVMVSLSKVVVVGDRRVRFLYTR